MIHYHRSKPHHCWKTKAVIGDWTQIYYEKTSTENMISFV